MQSFKFLVDFTLAYRDFTVLFYSLTRRRDPQYKYIYWYNNYRFSHY